MNQEVVTKNELDVSILWHSFTRDPDYKGKASSISTQNDLGPFDVLPQHANLISLIKDRIIVRTVDGKGVNYQFRNGVLEVSNNVVKIFLGI
ncbi:MAG: hypothetical protein WD231_04595 [Candidatus Woykebacteria bacterium]